jgi:hypothetical protein
MDAVRINPANSDHADKLFAFAGFVVSQCKLEGVHPVVYGSLAYSYYLPDDRGPINDVDFLVDEQCFQAIAAISSAIPGAICQPTDYHSMKLFKNESKIAFDSKEHYLNGMTPQIVTVSINGIAFDLVDRETLRAAYRQGAEKIPTKRASYIEKAEKLAIRA